MQALHLWVEAHYASCGTPWLLLSTFVVSHNTQALHLRLEASYCSVKYLLSLVACALLLCCRVAMFFVAVV